MKTQLREAFEEEMARAKALYRQQNWDQAFHHLERAHILGQRFVIPHTRSHWWMLKVGWHRRDRQEVTGQVVRILASLVISRIWVPLGNTGGANVSPVKPMPVPADLQALLDA
ncbi:hypothetical protein R50073_17460 [Maricurvus nonylphenolicus]|uniref:DUF3703 domain-containing protein n=1 Tax=Maricurvus nonylphenolicus TaxID=1008307 RepID=UPI0036F2A5EB